MARDNRPRKVAATLKRNGYLIDAPVAREVVEVLDGALPPLAGRAEVAEILGVRSENLGKVRGLPEPVQRLKATPVWIEPQIRELAKARARAAKAARRS
jgi:hypothetical protein